MGLTCAPRPASCSFAASMSPTTSCSPSTDPGSPRSVPCRLRSSNREPGGVSCTKRRSSLIRWSWSGSEADRVDIEGLGPVDVRHGIAPPVRASSPCGLSFGWWAYNAGLGGSVRRIASGAALSDLGPPRDHRLERQALAHAEALAFALQLAAGGEDVAAARGADRRGIAGAVDDVGEALDRLPVGALVVGARPGIERDQVDLGRDAARAAAPARARRRANR